MRTGRVLRRHTSGGLQRAWQLRNRRRGDWAPLDAVGAGAPNGAAGLAGPPMDLDADAGASASLALLPVGPDAWTCAAQAEGHVRAKEPTTALLVFHLIAADLPGCYQRATAAAAAAAPELAVSRVLRTRRRQPKP